MAGRDGKRQEIVLSPRCAEEHTLVHEVISPVVKSSHKKLFQILHALGLLHEHQRPDRDQYIDVDMVAIAKTGALRQFQKGSFLKV